MLIQLKGYLVEHRCASLSEIARQLTVEPETVRPMLERWVQKGKVRRTAASRCRGCATCREADLEFYQWVLPAADSDGGGLDQGCGGR